MNNIEILLNDVATKSFKHIVICGDFNINFLANSKEKEELLNLIDSFNLRTTIKDFTRIGKKSVSGLDQIIVNNDTDCTSETFYAGYSDHLAQILSIRNIESLSSTTPKSQLGRKFSERNIQNFTHILTQENWSSVYNTQNTNDKFDSFISILKKTLISVFH